MKKKSHNKLCIEDRMTIQGCIHDNLNITQISIIVGVNKSTISRELVNHSYIKEGFKVLNCAHLNKCNLCNGCGYSGLCHKEKHYYDFKIAQQQADNLKRVTRSKPKLSESEIAIIDEVVYEGVKNGLSLHHIYVSDERLQLICCELTIRRLVYRGNLRIRPHQLRKYVVYKREYKKEDKQFNVRDIRILIGRTFKDFLKFVNKKRKKPDVVEYDSVIGKINDKLAILTITFVDEDFQIGRVIKKGSSSSVLHEMKKIFSKFSDDEIKKIFPVNLCDNGTEFSSFNEIEINSNGEQICRVFFTNPYKSTDKADCERNHELVRYVLPKGKSLNFITQELLDEIFSNINSYVRKSKGDQTPYDLFVKRFGKETADKLNIKRIPNKKVRLLAII